MRLDGSGRAQEGSMTQERMQPLAVTRIRERMRSRHNFRCKEAL